MIKDKHEDYKLIYSPRTSLYNQKVIMEKLYNELSKSFDPYTVKILKRHFKEHFGSLDRDLFIGILKEHLLTWYPDLPNREETLIKLLLRLFNEIDLNSDHCLTWDEFSNYIIHVTNSKKIEYSVYNLQQYLLSKDTFNFIENRGKGFMQNKNDIEYFSTTISYCFYLNKLKCLGICYEGSNLIVFYDTFTFKKYGFVIDLLITQKEIDNYEFNELEEKTEVMLREQEEKIEKLINKLGDNNFRNNVKSEFSKSKTNNISNNNNENNNINNNNQNNNSKFQYNKKVKRRMHIITTCFADEYDLLFISTTNNKISAWKFDNKFNVFNNVNLISSNEFDFTFQKDEIKIPIFSTEQPQYAMCFDGPTNSLYTGQKDGKVLRWEMTSLKPVDILDAEKDKNSIPKNKINLPLIYNKYSKSSDNTMYNNNNTDENNKNELNKKKLQEKKRESVSCLLILEGLRLLCSAYFNGQLILWDTINKKPKKRYNDQQTGIYHVVFDVKRNYLYTCGFEHDIFVYDPYSNNKAIYKLRGHNGTVNSISLNSEINELVSIDILGTIKVWDTSRLICFQTININEKILLQQNGVKKEEELFELFSSHKKKTLSSNIYIEALPYVNKLLIYGEKFMLYEKGDTTDPLLTDSCMILGCCYDNRLNNIITFSNKNVKFWNICTGKLEKVYNDLVMISEITAYCIDKEFKSFYLGDSFGKVKSYYLSSGEYLREYEQHKDEISFIFSMKKYNYLISCSKDLCIKIHNESDLNKIIVLKEFYPSGINGVAFLDKNLLRKISLDEERGLLLISLTNGWIIDYDIEHFRFLLNLNPSYNESIRNVRIQNVLDILELDIIFVALENGEKYFLLKETNKYFDQYNIYKFGNFIEEHSINTDDDSKKNIVICSIFCPEENKIFTGDHLGFITCYDASCIKSVFDKNYKKEEIEKVLSNEINIKIIYKIEAHKESITFIDIPFELKPKIILTVSSDRTVQILDYYTGKFIDSFKVISIKFEPIPVAIKYYKQNPFLKKKNIKDEKNKLTNTELLMQERKEEKEINDYIKKLYENKLTENDKPPENVVYRYLLEQGGKPKKPKIPYDSNDAKADIDPISYAYDLMNYEIKSKFNNKLYGQKLLPYRSSNWNYNIDVNNMIIDDKNDLYKIREKLSNIEDEIRETEKYFEKLSINNKNYLPEYIKNLGQEEKSQINEIVYNKINTFNLAVTRKNIKKKEIQDILLWNEKNNNPNISISIENVGDFNTNNNTKNNIFSKGNNKIKKINNYNPLPSIRNKNNIRIINKNIETPAKFKSIDNLSDNKISIKNNVNINKSYINPKKKENKYKIVKGNDIKTINLSKDYTDRRFIGFKNEFDEKYNEFKKPLELLLKRNNKDYSKLFNKLSFNNINPIKNKNTSPNNKNIYDL